MLKYKKAAVLFAVGLFAFSSISFSYAAGSFSIPTKVNSTDPNFDNGLGFNAGNNSQAIPIKCLSVGECISGGLFKDRNNLFQPYVVEMHNGVWGDAKRISGAISSVNRSSSWVFTATCSSIGNCLVTGNIATTKGSIASYQNPFMAREVNGVWQSAEFLTIDPTADPGSATFNPSGQHTFINAAACPSDNWCIVVGNMWDSNSQTHTFYSVFNGTTWSKASFLNHGTFSEIGWFGDNNAGWSTDVECVSVGNCSIAGAVHNQSNIPVPFVATMNNSSVTDVKHFSVTNDSSTVSNADGYSGFFLSCWSSGNCVLAGSAQVSGNTEAVFASQDAGSWSSLKKITSDSSFDSNHGFNAGHSALIQLKNSLWCDSSGNCEAVGEYLNNAGVVLPFKVTYTPNLGLSYASTLTLSSSFGTPTLGTDHLYVMLSCANFGNCLAVGQITLNSTPTMIYSQESQSTWSSFENFASKFVDSSTAGSKFPGGFTTHADSYFNGISCVNVNWCMISGEYLDNSSFAQSFLLGFSNFGYTLNFDTQGGTPGFSSVSGLGGSSISYPGSPTRGSDSFAGWFTQATGGSATTWPYVPSASNQTLYAHWISPSTTVLTVQAPPSNSVVVFDSQGGSAVSSVVIQNGQFTSKPADPVLKGRIFLGWFVAPSGGNVMTFPYSPIPGSISVLYAQWKDEITSVQVQPTESKISVTFDSMGGSVIQGTFISQGEYLTSAAIPTRPGYAFLGWFTSAKDGEGISFPYLVNQKDPIKLFAYWSNLNESAPQTNNLESQVKVKLTIYFKSGFYSIQGTNLDKLNSFVEQASLAKASNIYVASNADASGSDAINRSIAKQRAKFTIIAIKKKASIMGFSPILTQLATTSTYVGQKWKSVEIYYLTSK